MHKEEDCHIASGFLKMSVKFEISQRKKLGFRKKGFSCKKKKKVEHHTTQKATFMLIN